MPFTTVGSEILVNTTTQATQTDQQITTLSGGRFVITWTDESGTGGDTSGPAVRAQVFEATGTPVGSEILVNSDTNGTQNLPQITALSNGAFVVSWKTSSGSVDIHAQVFAADGTRAGSEIAVNQNVANEQTDQQITALTGGRFVVTWKDSSGLGGDSDGTAVKAQVFNAGGGPVGSEILVNTEDDANQTHPRITALSDGGFVVTWEDYSGGNSDLRVQVFDADGTPVGFENIVNTLETGDQREPEVAALSGGGFAIVWTDDSHTAPDTNDSAVRVRVFEADGTPTVGQDILVNSATFGSQVEPKIQGLANGGFVVTWTDSSGQGDDTDGDSIRAQVFDDAGAPVGTEIVVNTTTASFQVDPRIAALADGGFVITFTDYSATGGDTSGAAIRAQAFSETGARVGTEILVNSTTTGSQLNPQVTALDEGGFVVTWRDDGDLRVQVFGIEGGAPAPTPAPPAPPPTEGTPGQDELTLSMTSDSYAAGSGNAWVWAGGGHDTVQGNTGNDVLHGYDGDDLMHGGKDDDEVLGEDGNDLLFGDLGNDLVHGGAGNDLCEGGEGNDIVRGGQGQDIVRGGAGDDWLSGDKGDDTLTGGAGADIFHSFTGAGIDRITDFSRAEGDRIQLDPGTTYTLAQTGADTIVTLTGGGQVVLAGVQLSTLGEGWILGA